MYDIKIIKRALKLLKQYDYSFIKVSRKLGIKVPTLRKWRNKEINNEPLLLHTRNKSSKWSESFKSEYNKPIINSTFYEFSKDMGFETILCRAFRPQTKGKVENLAKVMDRLDAYNNEFETLDELDEIVRELNMDLNNEISQATQESPIERFEKEKEYLNKLPRIDILEGFITKPITRKVSKDSMITFNKSKYSVHPKYIEKLLTLEVKANTLYIYYTKELVKMYKISKEYLNYTKDDVVENLKTDAFKHNDDKYIEDFIDKNMAIYDKLGG